MPAMGVAIVSSDGADLTSSPCLLIGMRPVVQRSAIVYVVDRKDSMNVVVEVAGLGGWGGMKHVRWLPDLILRYSRSNTSATSSAPPHLDRTGGSLIWTNPPMCEP
jgi:hypothetical protein